MNLSTNAFSTKRRTFSVKVTCRIVGRARAVPATNGRARCEVKPSVWLCHGNNMNGCAGPLPTGEKFNTHSKICRDCRAKSSSPQYRIRLDANGSAKEFWVLSKGHSEPTPFLVASEPP